jgi:MFS family permease
MRSPMHRQVLILASAQALFQVVSVMVVTIGGLAGGQIAPSPRWATLPVGTMFLGTAIALFPASIWMARVGRRAGFVTGAALGVLGGGVASFGVVQQSLAILSVGTGLLGGYAAFAQFYRFAASEVADDAFRPRAISLVLAGGIVAAIAGPLLARVGGPLFEPAYAGSFLIIGAVSVLALGVLLALRMPPAATPGPDAPHTARPWRALVLQPAYLVALSGGAVGFGVMILAMTATPIAMALHHHGLGAASTVIQMHVLGMFLPSFFTGPLIERFGVLEVMLAGVALLGAHVLTTLSGTGFGSFAGALVLLGVGWNFLYIGGTTLLTGTYTVAEKGRAQAINDMTIFVIGLGCSMGAGALLESLGWSGLNLVLIPWLALTAASLVWLGVRGGRFVTLRRARAGR